MLFKTFYKGHTGHTTTITTTNNKKKDVMEIMEASDSGMGSGLIYEGGAWT